MAYNTGKKMLHRYMSRGLGKKDILTQTKPSIPPSNGRPFPAKALGNHHGWEHRE